MVYSNTSLDELFELSMQSLHDVEPDEVFIVKELFRGFEWQRIDKGNRTKLGSMFHVFAKNEGQTQVEILGKTPQNQQMYRKL